MKIILTITGVFLLLATFKINAQIIYTDVIPDSTISATTQQFIARFNIDLNNDGTVDFYLKHFHPNVATSKAEFYTMIAQEGEVLVDGNDSPLALNLSDSIHSSLSFWINKAGQSTSAALFMNANWVGKNDKYVGLRFKINSLWHYGWIRLSVLADTSAIIVKDYAYISSPNIAITAGQLPIGNTGLSEVNQGIMSVYPNPTSGRMNVRLDDSYQKVDVLIKDISGKVVYSQTHYSIDNFYFEIQESSGIYFLEVIADDSKRHTLRISKQ